MPFKIKRKHTRRQKNRRVNRTRCRRQKISKRQKGGASISSWISPFSKSTSTFTSPLNHIYVLMHLVRLFEKCFEDPFQEVIGLEEINRQPRNDPRAAERGVVINFLNPQMTGNVNRFNLYPCINWYYLYNNNIYTDTYGNKHNSKISNKPNSLNLVASLNNRSSADYHNKYFPGVYINDINEVNFTKHKQILDFFSEPIAVELPNIDNSAYIFDENFKNANNWCFTFSFRIPCITINRNDEKYMYYLNHIRKQPMNSMMHFYNPNTLFIHKQYDVIIKYNEITIEIQYYYNVGLEDFSYFLTEENLSFEELGELLKLLVCEMRTHDENKIQHLLTIAEENGFPELINEENITRNINWDRLIEHVRFKRDITDNFRNSIEYIDNEYTHFCDNIIYPIIQRIMEMDAPYILK